MSDYDPFVHAEQLEVAVIYEGWIAPRDGLWVPDYRAILLRPGMYFIQERCVLAHEVGHAHYGHRDSSAHSEVMANRFAAEHLLDLDEVTALLRWTTDLARVCLELNVTMRTLRTFLNLSGLARRANRSELLSA